MKVISILATFIVLHYKTYKGRFFTKNISFEMRFCFHSFILAEIELRCSILPNILLRM